MSPFDYAFTPSRGPERSEAARQGREAVAIVARGHYDAPSGRRISIAEDVARAVAATREYEPGQLSDVPPRRGDGPKRVSVVNGTSLASARTMSASGTVPFVLNFASAKNPGGGFLNGARAQEESLARSSALYACLEGRGMYSHHRASRDTLYSDRMIWSPDVPVFRDDETGALLETPYPCTFLTSPAPNAGVVLERAPSRAEEVAHAMRQRIQRVLALAAAKRHPKLVLGAWGCGVFGNDPDFVAEAFRVELCGYPFDEVVFAVLDWSSDRRFIRPFAERF